MARAIRSSPLQACRRVAIAQVSAQDKPQTPQDVAQGRHRSAWQLERRHRRARATRGNFQEARSRA